MKGTILLLLVFVSALSAVSQTSKRNVPSLADAPAGRVAPASTSSLPIRRVILYSNGVAYIERRGTVTGNAEINLSFKQSQVDDVLKSMVVLDLGQGRIGAVSYNSSEPVSARMAEIPFAVSPVTPEGAGIAGVLSQLQGARVAVTSRRGTAIGSVLTVEKKTIRNEKETTITNILVIASESGEISSFDLNEVRSVKLLDEGTRNDLTEFANAAASARRLDAKTITVTSEGSGTREMVVSYTIAAPIWKTTYRVVLDKDGKPFFQGWAIVDNISEEDWSGVQMSLVSGSPISFIQNLQKPFYRYRPVVSPPRDLQLRPQVYEPEGVSGSGQTETVSTSISARQIEQLPLNGRNQSNLLQVQPGLSAQSNVTVDGLSNNSNVSVNSNFSRSRTSVSDALTTNSSGVTAAATGEEIGDLFEYRIDRPVSVARNRSALIPIVQTKMDGERVAVYNEGVRRDRPMSGVLLLNTTGLTLESGSMTVLDGDAYAGEALMDRLKSKERRIVSFALDLGTNIRVRDTETREPAKLIKAVNGTFQVHYFQSEEKIYQISNQTDRRKVLYIEYPVRDGWLLSEDSPKPDYVTQRYYRFRIELNGFEEKDVKISLRQPLMDSYQLTSLSTADLDLFVARRYVNDETRAKLAKLIELRSAIFKLHRRLESFDDEVEKIEDDQKRLRENIESLSKTAEAKTLIARYIAKAGEQETRLEEMEKERRSIEAEKERLERQLAAEITVFEIK